MTTNNQNSNQQDMIKLSTNNLYEAKLHLQPYSMQDGELLSIPDEEDEADLDQNPEQESSIPVLSTDPSIPVRPWSDFSLPTTSTPTKKPQSRAYRFVQLEQALKSANLLRNNKDRLKFQADYRESLLQNAFEDFLKTYYKKLEDHYEKIRYENHMKKSRTFTFVDLEKNFLALDPTHDIKIVFLDNKTIGTTRKIRPTLLSATNSERVHIDSDPDLEN